MIRRSRQFSLSPHWERCDWELSCEVTLLTVCQELKKSRLNVAGYEVFLPSAH
jgi:hypothetical protein